MNQRGLRARLCSLLNYVCRLYDGLSTVPCWLVDEPTASLLCRYILEVNYYKTWGLLFGISKIAYCYSIILLRIVTFFYHIFVSDIKQPYTTYKSKCNCGVRKMRIVREGARTHNSYKTIKGGLETVRKFMNYLLYLFSWFLETTCQGALPNS